MTGTRYLFLAFFLLLSPAWTWASPVGAVTASEGQTEIIHPGQPGIPASAGMPVHTGDLAKTEKGSKIEIRFDDGSIIRIGENSRAEISEYLFQDDRVLAKIFLHGGKIRSIVKKAAQIFGMEEANRFEVHTDTAVIGVRGTDFVTSRREKVVRATFITGEGYCYHRGNPEAVEKVVSGQSVTVSQTDVPPQVQPADEAETQEDIKDTTTWKDSDFMPPDFMHNAGLDDTRTASPY